jgi:hypothetical protein
MIPTQMYYMRLANIIEIINRFVVTAHHESGPGLKIGMNDFCDTFGYPSRIHFHYYYLKCLEKVFKLLWENENRIDSEIELARSVKKISC